MYFRLTTGKTTLTCIKKSLSYSTNSGTFPFQCKKLERRWQCLKLQISNFHTTPKLNYPGSLLLCFGSIYCGHSVRKWWLKQTPEQQLKYIKWFSQRKRIFYGSLGFLSFVLVFYCLTHLEIDPVKKKSRLILFDQTRQIEDSKIFYKMIVQNEKNIVPLRDPKYKIIARALKKLIYSNKNLFENTDWTITIIHRMFNIASFPNVMILPDRNIIILVDIFNFIKSSDQLIFILAHEMSHNMLLHTSEIPTFAMIYTIATIISSFLIWVFYEKRVAAIFCSVLYTVFAAIFSAYKRQKEIEADDVGLELAAKSCIDVREVLIFWEIMMKFEELSEQNKFQIPLFMDHPTSEERKKRTIQLMPTILELRKQAKCRELPAKDPRDRLPYYLKDIEKHMLKDTRILGMRF